MAITLRESKGSPLTHQEMDDNFIMLIPAGAVFHFAMITPPDGYLECDGSAISRSHYNRLFSAIGTLYGEGDGSTTFNLPDLRGEFIRGWDNDRGIDNNRKLGSVQLDALETHNHGLNANRLLAAFNNDNIGPSGLSVSGVALSCYRNSNQTSYNTAKTSLETRPRNIALLPCIKY